jgi:hypothetical protein
MPTLALAGVPQFGQKRIFSGTEVPQLEQERVEICDMDFFPFDEALLLVYSARAESASLELGISQVKLGVIHAEVIYLEVG